MNHLQFQVSAGTIAVTWNSQGLLTRIDWYDNSRVSPEVPSGTSWFALAKVEIPDVLNGLIESLRRYFESGEPIGEVPWEILDLRQLTDFQIQVYRMIAEIPHGETRSYAWVARKIGKSAAGRAVGQALRKNPFPILVPCHRIVSSNASLGGFMGASDPNQPELRFKRRLIELENEYRNPVFEFLAGTEASWDFSLAIPT